MRINGEKVTLLIRVLKLWVERMPIMNVGKLPRYLNIFESRRAWEPDIPKSQISLVPIMGAKYDRTANISGAIYAQAPDIRESDTS